MRVQAADSIDGVAVEYYDTSYNLISSKLIPEELPIFGGFYAADNNYFLLTGQENPNESRDIATYRITKYTKDWKRIGFRGLKNCDTTIPFRAGSARMIAVGDYLFVHTSHQMYKSSKDSKNHQANVTLQLDMKTNHYTDALYKVASSSLVYVSHSFNQFIRAENNRIVTLDHGDAYPRSLVLIEYPDNVTKGKFVPRNSTCTVTDVFTYPGETGENQEGKIIGSENLIAEEGKLDHMMTVDKRLPILPSAFLEGFIFDGWYTYGDTLVTETTDFTEEQVVYAHYTEDKQAKSPDKVSQIRVKSTSKGKMTVTWEPTDAADGYEIAYAVNKKFPSDNTYVKKSNANDRTKTISKLSKGKTYYVKVRAFQNSDGKKLYGEWSSVKKVKIKK